MQQSDVGDNPQVTVTEAEKGWLAGMIDGEGCIHVVGDWKSVWARVGSGASNPWLA